MKIEQIKENFKIDAGAPTPTILSNENNLYLIFYIDKIDKNWDGTKVHIRNENDKGIITIKFDRFAQFKFGNPNDETISGHRYSKIGLEPYSIQKVINSDWINELITINSVHPYHKKEQFDKFEHFIFFFHDTCFEIVSEKYSIDKNSLPNMKDEIKRVSQLI